MRWLLAFVLVMVLVATAGNSYGLEMLTFPNDIDIAPVKPLYAYSFEDGDFDSNTSCWMNLVTGEYDACMQDTNSTNGNVLFTSVGGAFGKGIALGTDDKIVIQNTSNLYLKSFTIMMFLYYGSAPM